MLPIHKYMDKVGLSEFVSVSVEPIPDEEDPSRVTDSYLLVYYPIFRVITTWRLIFTAIIFIAGAWAVIKFV
jgi:hypothetical protein